MNAFIIKYFPATVSYLFILLFIYAAISKLLDFENFQAQLGQSPLLSAFAGYVSYAIILIEVLISILLAVPKYRTLGLIASFSLMIMFTTYIVVILNFTSYIPCSCGGVLEKMGWTEHLIFNISFVVLALLALLIPRLVKRIMLLVSVGITSAFIIIALYFASEDIMQKQNPFIRRFDHIPVKLISETRLESFNYYLAGKSDDRIYLGNTTAPLHLLSFDTVLNNQLQARIVLDNYHYPFRAATIHVLDSVFFVSDGTVPIIFRGSTLDWKATKVIHGNQRFTKILPLRRDFLAFRALTRQSGENILGSINLQGNNKIRFAPAVLQKQIDGLFDTDGVINYSNELRRLVYIYNYRNQFIVADNDLLVLSRGNTIDTISRAQLEVAHLKQTGDRLLSAPPLRVNISSAVSGKYLFVRSALRGRYESRKKWENTSVFDVYDILNNTYKSSFYIPSSGRPKIKDFIISRNHLYALVEDKLMVYELSDSYAQQGPE